MKISTAKKDGVTPNIIETIVSLVDQIPWPSRRQAMGEETTMLLDGKPRIAEDVFGWNRSTVELGMNELRTGIYCINDLLSRCKPKTEKKYPEMLADIHNIMEPKCRGSRSQFLQRMVDFSVKSGLEIHLAYYPPYHSKYNAIEHYWGGLEKSWNGYLLESVETILKRATNFVWKAMQPTVTLFTAIYEKGVRLYAKAKRVLERHFFRSEALPKYDIVIKP